jgi:hypothetical protein
MKTSTALGDASVVMTRRAAAVIGPPAQTEADHCGITVRGAADAATGDVRSAGARPAAGVVVLAIRPIASDAMRPVDPEGRDERPWRSTPSAPRQVSNRIVPSTQQRSDFLSSAAISAPLPNAATVSQVMASPSPTPTRRRVQFLPAFETFGSASAAQNAKKAQSIDIGDLLVEIP